MGLVLRGAKGSRLKYTELDGNFTYLLGEIVRVEGLTSSVNAVRFNAQSLTTVEQNQARANIGAVDFRLSGLANNLSASEREVVREKLGIVDQSLNISFKRIKVDGNFYKVGPEEFTRLLVDFGVTPYDRVVILDGTFEGQELILRCGTFTGSVALAKLTMTVLLADGKVVSEYGLSTNTTARFVWTSLGWANI